MTQWGRFRRSADRAAVSYRVHKFDSCLNFRTRQFVRQLRGCQAGIAVLVSAMRSSGANPDLVTLSGETKTVKDICSAVRDRMATMDTTHFNDQALTVEVAINEYKDGLDDVRNYLDTAAPSKAANAAVAAGRARPWCPRAGCARRARRQRTGSSRASRRSGWL
jgi:hypothetical protein